jgi:drug/metabolite transporter (DMT)-like permease
MIPSFLTAILWSISAVCATRSTRYLGGALANLTRLFLGTILLALWAHLFGMGLRGAGLWFFVLSGLAGFGLGDVAGYEALPRLGSRLGILIMQCVAAPIGALIEWLWLGTTLSPVQIFCGLLILAGVAIALAPKDHLQIERKCLVSGIVFGLVAALGQALGAVLSRKAYQVAALAGQSIDGGTAAYQRILGGLGVAALFFVVIQAQTKESKARSPGAWGAAWPWIIFNVLAGPTVGVSCYQWALATTPSGIVLPIVATTPLVIIPFSYKVEGDRPGVRSLIGGAIAVAGAVALTLVR